MLAREGIRVGEKHVERRMRLAGLQGAHRGRRKGVQDLFSRGIVGRSVDA